MVSIILEENKNERSEKMNIIEKIEMYLSEACPGDKKKSKGKGKGLGKGKGEGPIGRFKDEDDKEDE